MVIAAAKTISRRHGILSYKDGQWRLENIGRNGIQVNGAAIGASRALANGRNRGATSAGSAATSVPPVTGSTAPTSCSPKCKNAP